MAPEFPPGTFKYFSVEFVSSVTSSSSSKELQSAAQKYYSALGFGVPRVSDGDDSFSPVNLRADNTIKVSKDCWLWNRPQFNPLQSSYRFCCSYHFCQRIEWLTTNWLSYLYRSLKILFWFLKWNMMSSPSGERLSGFGIICNVGNWSINNFIQRLILFALQLLLTQSQLFTRQNIVRSDRQISTLSILQQMISDRSQANKWKTCVTTGLCLGEIISFQCRQGNYHA